ncbi:hypothetical protein J1614_010750, partial [Plenodomus biglobosus]
MCCKDRIYVLGVGNIGKFVAHALRKQHPWLPISLLFHRPDLIDDWDAAEETIVCITNGCSDKRAGFNVEIISSSTNPNCSQALGNPIKHLIVATKTHFTIHALSLVKHRLQSSSSILFLQNGIGIPLPNTLPNECLGSIDEVSASVFSNIQSRPSYWAGICSCSIYCSSPFSIVHAGRGAIEVGLVWRASYEPSPSIPTDLVPSDLMAQLLLKTPAIEATLVTPDRITEAQLRKLTVNAVINPLTAIFRCKNGELLDHPQRFALMRKLFEEVADIVWAILPRASQSSDNSVFTKETLWLPVLRVAMSSRESTTSMLQDIEAGRRTEIDYINGYLAAQGRRLGLTCIYNNAIIEMVKKHRVIQDDEIESAFRIASHVSGGTLFSE